jgi:hypothetical protein
VLRILLVLTGGVVLPAASLSLNEAMTVVDLGTFGAAGVAMAALSALANLLLSPRRRDPATGRMRHDPPRSLLLRLALLWSAALSCVLWGYLALLFLPLLPLSVVAVIFFGIGLCGLTPYGAAAIAVIHTVRGYRAVRGDLGRRWAFAALVIPLLLPVLVGAGGGLEERYHRRAMGRLLDAAAATRPFSRQRMELISRLEGYQRRLIEGYLRTEDRERRALIAEVYLRLEDTTLNQAVDHRYEQTSQHIIRPWWFLQGVSPLHHQRLWRF